MAITAGGSLNAVAAPTKATLSSNFINFIDGSTGWEQQYLPDLMEKEVERYGKRTISGFLSQVGAEEASHADRVVWSEQGRLHLSYDGDISNAGVFTVASSGTHAVRVGATVVLSDNKGVVIPGYVSAIASDQTTMTILPYEAATVGAVSGFQTDDDGTNSASVFVYGSEFGKGTNGLGIDGKTNTFAAVEPSFQAFSNQMIIMKDTYRVSGSDAAAIGWVEVSGEEGQNGYYWYLKANGDTMARFADYCEMTLLESKETVANSTVEDAANVGTGASSGTGAAGTVGLFQWITTYGHTSTGITGVNAATDLAEFDAILAKFDSQGAIEENMMFVNRDVSLAIDDMLASMNSYGAGGTSYGVFNNSEDMALNLGFSGFRRGSYDFYKSDWKYLNDGALRAGLGYNDVRGVIIPAGTSSVYDEMLGKNMKRPFLHMRYRASNTESRKLKTWITDSVGAATSDLDAMTVNYLSERCLVVQGGNNFMLLNK
jgi:hypothetical protein